jgi:hypothetical protein
MEKGKDFLTQWEQYTDKIFKELIASDQSSNQSSQHHNFDHLLFGNTA